jgi:hypothetical protein
MYLTPEVITAFNKKQKEYADRLGEPLPEPRWEAEKKRLIEHNQDDEFYFLVNLKTLKITWHHNMNKILGYDKEPEFDESFFDELVHPYILHYFNAFALGMYDVVFEGKDELSYMNLRYKITVPFRKANGQYVTVQQISYPCEFDAQGQLVTHYSRYIVNNHSYIGEPLQPSIQFNNEVDDHLMARLYQNTANLMSIGNPKAMFTRDEVKVLHEAYKISHEKTYTRSKLLQDKFKFTVRHKNVSIKQKTEFMLFNHLEQIPKPDPLSNYETCLPKFEDVYQIAQFLQHAHILPLIDIKLRNR